MFLGVKYTKNHNYTYYLVYTGKSKDTAKLSTPTRSVMPNEDFRAFIDILLSSGKHEVQFVDDYRVMNF